MPKDIYVAPLEKKAVQKITKLFEKGHNIFGTMFFLRKDLSECRKKIAKQKKVIEKRKNGFSLWGTSLSESILNDLLEEKASLEEAIKIIKKEINKAKGSL